MTDTESVAPSAPKPRAKPPARRRPAPRSKHDQDEVVDVAELARHANGSIDRLAQLERELAELKAGGMRTVESQPANPVATSRVAADEELTPWQLRVRERTEPTPRHLDRRERAFNYPEVLYMKPDGSVVSLQGDPGNYAYYTAKKKFHALSDAEVREYLTVERPKIARVQQQKAALINTIRRAVQVDPALAAGLDPSWELDLDRMNIPELQAQLDDIAGMPTASGQKRRLMRRLPRLQDADDRAAEAEAARLMAGVETTPTRTALEAFENGLPNIPRRTHEIEVTPQNAVQFR